MLVFIAMIEPREDGSQRPQRVQRFLQILGVLVSDHFMAISCVCMARLKSRDLELSSLECDVVEKGFDRNFGHPENIRAYEI